MPWKVARLVVLAKRKHGFTKTLFSWCSQFFFRGLVFESLIAWSAIICLALDKGACMTSNSSEPRIDKNLRLSCPRVAVIKASCFDLISLNVTRKRKPPKPPPPQFRREQVLTTIRAIPCERFPIFRERS